MWMAWTDKHRIVVARASFMFGQKSRKIASPKIINNSTTPKYWIYAKRISKWSQHQCQNSCQHLYRKKQQQYNYILSCSVKVCKFIVRVIKIEGFARWVRKQQAHQLMIKNDTQIHVQIDEKSLLNPCSKKWCQSDGQTRQKGTHRDAQSEEARKEIMQKTMLKLKAGKKC